MSTFLLGLFLLLHGLVHLLYAGQSRRLYELRPNLVWPDGSWAFARTLSDETSRLLASVCLVLAAVGFLAGGLGLLLAQDWWRAATVSAAAVSIVVFVLFWNGGLKGLADQGGGGVLISLATLVVVLILRWPV
jgi:hypothetical protein